MADHNLSKQKTLVALLAITLLSAVVRVVGLNQIPPGLWFDEAWVSVVARDWGNELYYAASFGGMHPAIVYLTKFGALFTKQHPLTIRYLIAAVSTLTVPLTFFATRPLFMLTNRQDDSESADWLALVSATVISITYPFFHFSRLGFESILPAPFALVAFGLCAWLIQRQLVKSTWLDPVSLLVGGWLGLTIYTFDTSRFIPIAIAATIALVWFNNRDRWQLPHALANLSAITFIALLVGAPLLQYFWLNWDAFIVRAEVTTLNTLGEGAASVPLALLSNLGRTLGGLVIPGWGDGLARHNLPGRPVFDIFLAIFLFVGTVRLFSKKQSTLALIVFPWLFITLLPVILTDNAPTYTRIFGAIPALVIIIAVGGRTVWDNVPSRWRWLFPMLLLSSAALTGFDYFVRWPSAPTYFNDFQTAEWDLAQAALRESENSVVVFTPRRPYLSDPTYDLLLQDSTVRQVAAPSCPIYRPGETVRYLLNQGESDVEIQELKAQFGSGQIVDIQELFYRSSLDVIGQVVSLKAKPPAVGLTPGADFELIQLVGHNQLADRYSAGQPIELSLHWQVANQPIGQDYTLFAHVYAADDLSVPLAQLDGQPCLATGRWFAGDRLIDTRQLGLPQTLPPGEYVLALGWYDPVTFDRLELKSDQALSDNRLLLWQFGVDQ